MATNPERTSSGLLQINVINIQNNFPIQNARVTISYKGEPDRTVEQLTTNSSGQTEQVQLPAPPCGIQSGTKHYPALFRI